MRNISSLVAVLGVAAILVPLGNSRATTHAGVPTLYVQYTMNCTFSFADDSGNRITSIAPGTYEVEVSTPIMFKLVDTLNQAPGDMTGCRGWVQFQMTGPGVTLSTTLDTGCDSFYLLPEQTFKAGQTYTAVDLNQPSVTRTALTVLQAGAAPSPQSPYGNGTGKGQTTQDIVGSAAAKTAIKATLYGSLSAGGALVMKNNGKSVSSLTAGRYRFVITDKDPKASVMLSGGKVVKTLSAAGFVGRHSTTVTLTAGHWTYSVNPGKGYTLTVSG
jgi:hypothetical protein